MTTSSLTELVQRLERGELAVDSFAAQVHELFAGGPTGETSPGGPEPLLGDYLVLAGLAGGGMGLIMRARHRDPGVVAAQGGEVALKLLRAQFFDDDEARGRFEAEAELGMRLDHKGLVRVFDYLHIGPALVMVMELIEGREMAQMIGRETGPIPWARALPVFAQLAGAVSYLHRQGIVHRDLKPANVMITDGGEVKLLDLGIAKDPDSSAELTSAGAGMGTLNYVAPEQAEDASLVDGRADIYALGMTLYQMLAGRLPWEPRDSPIQTLRRKLDGDLAPPSSFYPAVPGELEEVVGRCLAVDPDARYATIEALLAAIDRAVEAIQDHLRRGDALSTLPAERLLAWDQALGNTGGLRSPRGDGSVPRERLGRFAVPRTPLGVALASAVGALLVAAVLIAAVVLLRGGDGGTEEAPSANSPTALAVPLPSPPSRAESPVATAPPGLESVARATAAPPAPDDPVREASEGGPPSETHTEEVLDRPAIDFQGRIPGWVRDILEGEGANQYDLAIREARFKAAAQVHVYFDAERPTSAEDFRNRMHARGGVEALRLRRDGVTGYVLELKVSLTR
ncbi:MAG: serine/threonine protein kinase [Proteobacteria bacterium]|nr:serine/threonine protein kinase [Pseudomonadota bacterium]